jgi:hypothetical protein
LKHFGNLPGIVPVLRLAAVAAGALVLASCGGGGAADGSSGTAASGSYSTNTGSANAGATTSTTSTAGSTGWNSATPISSATPVQYASAMTLVSAPVSADGWTLCASEGEVCSVPGPRQVRYGANGSYAYQTVGDSIPCNNATFSDSASGRKTCEYAPDNAAPVAGIVFARANSGRVLQVGPNKPFARPCDAFAAASDGDTIEIDAAGSYNGDVCAIYPNDLTIRGVNGRPHIDAAHNQYGGKGTWVVKGMRTLIDNVELSGAAVPDNNGAAIRLDGIHLTVTNSFIHDNEDGILTSNDYTSDIVVEHCEFGHNGYGDGYSHNLYIGRVASLTFRYNYSHDANQGHNLKSRAGSNTIAYNRFSSTAPGAAGSTAIGQPSYEIDLPWGGNTVIMGNVIEQPAYNSNSNILAYAEEGVKDANLQSLYVVNNTFVNDAGSGQFLMIGDSVSKPVFLQNNVFAGPGGIITQGSAIQRNNYAAMFPAFVDRAGYDLHPAPGAPFIGAGAAAGVTLTGESLTPVFEYVHAAGSVARPARSPIDIGAYAAR